MASPIRIVPFNEPIIQVIEASSVTPGIQITMYLQPPSTDVIKSVVTENTAYIATCPIGAKEFKDFDSLFESALSMSIKDYLEILNFFNTKWSEIENDLEILCGKIRKLKGPKVKKPLADNLSLQIHGSCVFQHSFQNVYLTYRKYSHDFTSPYVVLQRHHKSIALNLHYLKELATQHDQLVLALHGAGYDFEEIYESVD